MNGIKTWRERIKNWYTDYDKFEAMQAEIDELRTALLDRGAQLAAPSTPQGWADFVEVACARIKSADDAAMNGDYMLDSDDCIEVIRGTWGGNFLNDKPEKQKEPT